MKRIVNFLIDVLVFGSLYIGFIYGVQGATNIGYFAGWFFGLLNLVGLLIPSVREKAAADYKHQNLCWRIYDGFTDLIYVCFAVYSGWFVLGTIYAISAGLKAHFKAEQEKNLELHIPGNPE
ncbi:hypothetical protein QQF54_08620 [Lelliottia sp. V106_10]|uniref:hypothetical protein n=1 Tax=Lelliottia wanjuensis TaxID=3050585 RepID=UPI00254E680E|nr:MULTISPECIES: hypothetical protein [unclassified Lelliottia]MDK9373417.1 hypothetical protein [Lelliottia sp. V106_10]MDK9600210.1 hypothetical protein [Lelliottia sp. V106_5]